MSGGPKYAIWQVPAHWAASRWVVIRPDLTVLGYFRSFETARRAYIADVATMKHLQRAQPPRQLVMGGRS